MPVAVTAKVAGCPTTTLCPAGWAVIDGAVALLDPDVPAVVPLLLTWTLPPPHAIRHKDSCIDSSSVILDVIEISGELNRGVYSGVRLL